MMTSMLKNPAARFLGISTAAATLDSALGRLRARALGGPEVAPEGPVLEAGGERPRWLEWLRRGRRPDDLRAVAGVQPAAHRRRDRRAAPARHRGRVAPVPSAAAGASAPRAGSPRRLAACRAVYEVEPDEPLILGVDVGGSRRATAVVGRRGGDGRRARRGHRGVAGLEAVLEATAYIERLIAADGRPIARSRVRPHAILVEGLRLERDHGLALTEWPQSESRMTICSERLHGLVVEQRLQHPGDPELDGTSPTPSRSQPRAAGGSSRRDAAQIDGVIALAMAAERAAQPVEPTRFLGWL